MKALLIVAIVVTGFVYQAEATERLRRVQPKQQGNQRNIEKQKTLEELQKEHALQEWVKEQKEAGKQVPYAYCAGNRLYHNWSDVYIRPQFQNLTEYKIKGLFYAVKVTDSFDNLIHEEEITEAIDIAPWCLAESDGKLHTTYAAFEKLQKLIDEKMVKVIITVTKVQWANGKTTDNYPAQPKNTKQQTKVVK